MIFEIVNTTRCSVDNYGNVTVLSTSSQMIPIETSTIRDSIVITQSQKDYNYLTLGKHSAIQLEHATPITVKCEDTTAKTRTHKTQLNRFDKMKDILAHLDVGEEVTIEWNPSNNTITIIKQ